MLFVRSVGVQVTVCVAWSGVEARTASYEYSLGDRRGVRLHLNMTDVDGSAMNGHREPRTTSMCV